MGVIADVWRVACWKLAQANFRCHNATWFMDRTSRLSVHARMLDPTLYFSFTPQEPI